MQKNAEEKTTGDWKDIADQIRSIRRIDLRIHQLQKQRYLGITALYNKVMQKVYPNYDEFSQNQKIKFKSFKSSKGKDGRENSESRGIE